ncbi:MAG: hypothetical protein IJM92_04095 [Fibrobacter sp.]|uniref:hypothetical protein n=1 Tax=Fibrobacter sp. TaxID=35828 RepID=UPI0025B81361|nr:hypothetical protein [Fibrobacter sp.]MBQ7078844.1 hypothetical protein [Fibrobacter sp.]
MKIEKRKITNSSRLSNATKAGIASMLGMSAVLMSGCLGEAESGQVIGPVEPDNNNPNSSDASEGPEIASSSSVADIPLSHEHLSSEVVEALSSSSVQTPSSSSENIASSSSDVPSSSSEKAVSSSSESSSSTIVEKPLSSSSNAVVPPWPRERTCETVDSTGIHVIMCHDDDRGMMASMVSTYEMLDLS